ncbi:MAG: hypothetical protein GX030_02565 [Firmicutes bacterium]|nr:hypothetical protein [Bacillota bacterium]
MAAPLGVDLPHPDGMLFSVGGWFFEDDVWRYELWMPMTIPAERAARHWRNHFSRGALRVEAYDWVEENAEYIYEQAKKDPYLTEPLSLEEAKEVMRYIVVDSRRAKGPGYTIEWQVYANPDHDPKLRAILPPDSYPDYDDVDDDDKIVSLVKTVIAGNGTHLTPPQEYLQRLVLPIYPRGSDVLKIVLDRVEGPPNRSGFLNEATLVMMKSGDSFAAVTHWYRQRLAQEGWVGLPFLNPELLKDAATRLKDMGHGFNQIFGGDREVLKSLGEITDFDFGVYFRERHVCFLGAISGPEGTVIMGYTFAGPEIDIRDELPWPLPF